MPAESSPTGIDARSVAYQAGVTFIRMLSQFLVSAVPFSAFARRLRLVASIAQPLKILQRVVVSRNDVVAIGSDSVAVLRVDLRFAPSMRAGLDHGPALLPIIGESESSVAVVPVHLIAHQPPSTRHGQVVQGASGGIRTRDYTQQRGREKELAAGTIYH